MRRTLIRIGLALLLALAVTQGVLMGLNTGRGERERAAAHGPEAPASR